MTHSEDPRARIFLDFYSHSRWSREAVESGAYLNRDPDWFPWAKGENDEREEREDRERKAH